MFNTKKEIPSTAFYKDAVNEVVGAMKSLRQEAKMKDLVKSFKQLGLSAEDITQIFVDCGDESSKVKEVLDDLGDTGVKGVDKLKLIFKGLGESAEGAATLNAKLYKLGADPKGLAPFFTPMRTRKKRGSLLFF